MGDSSKKDDPTTLGTFDSGLKYTIALLLRNEVDIKIDVLGGSLEREDWAEDFTEEFSFGTYTHYCESTGKQKELIKVDINTTYHGGTPMSQHDMREPSSGEHHVVPTGFAKALGFNWSLWMSLRELWSNMLDEKGSVVEGNIVEGKLTEGTVITLTFEENNPFYKVWTNRHLYINEEKPLFVISDKLDILKNDEKYLRIYKQNILVYSDEKVPSKFAFNIKFGDIDERRILSNLYQVESNIVTEIKYTDNEQFLREIIRSDFRSEENEFLSSTSSYGNASDLMHNIAQEVYKEYGDVNSYPWLMQSIRERKDCKIGGKVITSVEDSLWSYSSKTSIESPPVAYPVSVEDTVTPLQAEVNKKYNFNLDWIDVKTAKLKGSKVIADKFENCLIVDESFTVEENMPEFIIQYIDLTRKGNVVKNLGEYICELLKR
jgi:hypothetical protein